MINNRENFINEINSFLRSEDSGMLITGNHHNEKHRLLVALIDNYFINTTILFRTDSMNKITDHFRFHSMTTPKAGDIVVFGHNSYEFDAFTDSDTWLKTSNNFRVAIVYPIDQLVKKAFMLESIENLFEKKIINKVFFVSWTDCKGSDYSILNKYVQHKCVLDSFEEYSRYFQQDSRVDVIA